ncbi:MAG: hypothetical protein ACTSRW_07120 [Candidatus Helarchaeota archaeon]
MNLGVFEGLAMALMEREPEKNKKQGEKSIDELEKEAMKISKKISRDSEQMKQRINLKTKMEQIDPEILKAIEKKVEQRLRREFERYKKEFERKLRLRYQFKLEEELEKLAESKKDKVFEELEKKLKETYPWAFNEKLKPWMFFYKTDKEREQFIQEWSAFILDYSRVYLLHIFDFLTKSTEPPFKYLREREKYLREILEDLANTDYGEWINPEKTRLRIYWKSLEEWANKLFEYCFWNGTDILTMMDIKEIGDEVDRGFGSLPPQDIRKILEILIKKKKAQWINKTKRSIKLKFEDG